LQTACLNISWVPPLSLRKLVKQLQPIAFTAFFSQTLRQTNKGKCLDPRDLFVDQGFLICPFLASFNMMTTELL
jgi:hypothetical protein